MPENTEEAVPTAPAPVPNVDIPHDIGAELDEEVARLRREQELGLSHDEIVELEMERDHIIKRLNAINLVLNG
jgi:hypothetical protein